MKYLYFDTETTGMIKFKEPLSSPDQPRLVQFAAVLADEEKEISSCNFIIDPEDVIIPPEVVAIHGISTEFAKTNGVPLKTVVSVWESLVARADELVGHNVSFDLKIMQIAAIQAACSIVELPPTFCTMHNSTKIVQAPPTPKMLAANKKGPKQPTLTECVKFFFNEDFSKAHDALADTRACMKVHKAIKQRQVDDMVF